MLDSAIEQADRMEKQRNRVALPSLKKETLKIIQNIVLSSCIALQLSCGDQREISIKEAIQFEGKMYLLNEDDPFSGIIYDLYDNGHREYEGHYKDGKPNGPLINYYENGNIKRKGSLKNGIPSGVWTYYKLDGSIEKTESN